MPEEFNPFAEYKLPFSQEGTRKNKIEEPYRDVYQAWKASPDPRTTSVLLQKLNPALEKGIRAHTGGRVDPIMRGHARRIALNALDSYDPQKGRLDTHLYNHLAALRRISRRQDQVIPIPERVTLDLYELRQAENELTSDLGREPSTQELADFTGLSMRRIAHIRRFPSGRAVGEFERTPGEEDDIRVPEIARTPMVDSILDAVYDELQPVDKLIMEHSLGLNEKEYLGTNELAKRINLSPGAISQRKARIMEKINLLSGAL